MYICVYASIVSVSEQISSEDSDAARSGDSHVKRYCRIEVFRPSDEGFPDRGWRPTRLRLASLSTVPAPDQMHICFISSWLGYLSKSFVLQEFRQLSTSMPSRIRVHPHTKAGDSSHEKPDGALNSWCTHSFNALTKRQ